MKSAAHHIVKLLLVILFIGILPPCTAQSVNVVEYFFDADPGPGNGIQIPLNAAAQIDTTVTFNMSQAGPGLHQLFIRTGDTKNHWSLYKSFPVFKGAGQAPVILQKLEYFFDNDPGTGNGIPLGLSPALQADTTVSIDLSSVTDGLHQLFIRAMDITGKWSIYRASPVIKGPGYYQPLTVNRLEYFIDNDPGIAKGIPVALNPALSTDNTVLLAIPDTVTKDSVHVFIRAQDNRGLWGLYFDTTVAVTCKMFVIKPPHIGYQADSCGNKVVSFTDTTSAAAWKWNFGNGDSASGQHTVYSFAQPGLYTISHYIINKRGCISDTISLPVIVQPPLSVNAGPDQEIYTGDVITLAPVIKGNDSSYLWTPDIYMNNNTIRNPTVTGVADTKYIISVTGKGNCIASDTVFIKVNKSVRVIEIPNAFSPNGDGINDTWLIKYLNTYPSCRVQVFNRYGQIVFETNGYGTPWNGRYHDKTLPLGTYYYIINLNNGQHPFSGAVSIIY